MTTTSDQQKMRTNQLFVNNLCYDKTKCILRIHRSEYDMQNMNNTNNDDDDDYDDDIFNYLRRRREQHEQHKGCENVSEFDKIHCSFCVEAMNEINKNPSTFEQLLKKYMEYLQEQQHRVSVFYGMNGETMEMIKSVHKDIPFVTVMVQLKMMNYSSGQCTDTILDGGREEIDVATTSRSNVLIRTPSGNRST